MSTFSDTMALISELHRKISDQRKLLLGFQKAHRDEITDVTNGLLGTMGGYDKDAIDGLRALDDHIKKALAQLDYADAALRKVERI